MSDENEKLSGGSTPDEMEKLGNDPDFEGHRYGDGQLTDQLTDQLSDRADDAGDPDFEGHKLGDQQLTEKLDG